MIPYILLAGAVWLLTSESGQRQGGDMPQTPRPMPSSLTQRERDMLSRIEETSPHLLRWVPVQVSSGSNTATLYVSPDYWGVGEDSSYLRVPLTPKAAQWVADQLGAVLPTKKMVDLIEQRSSIIPFIGYSPTRGESRNSQRLWEASNASAQRGMRVPPGFLVSGHKKDVIVGNVLARNPGKVIIFGGRYSNGSRVQPESALHGDFYVDYSHGVRLINKRMDVNGAPMLVHDVLRNRDLAPLISSDGVVATTGLRYPA